MSKSTPEKLVHLANQIATNLATEADPVAAIAEHIVLFWDPRMKQIITAYAGTGLSPNAKAAIMTLS